MSLSNISGFSRTLQSLLSSRIGSSSSAPESSNSREPGLMICVSGICSAAPTSLYTSTSLDSRTIHNSRTSM